MNETNKTNIYFSALIHIIFPHEDESKKEFFLFSLFKNIFKAFLVYKNNKFNILNNPIKLLNSKNNGICEIINISILKILFLSYFLK